MLKPLSFLLILVSIAHIGIAQKRYNISGTITDISTGETLIGASVKLQELPQSGSLSNSYGFYSIGATEGRYVMISSYIGYKTYTDTITVDKNFVINIALQSQAMLEEVVISTSRKKQQKYFFSANGY